MPHATYDVSTCVRHRLHLGTAYFTCNSASRNIAFACDFAFTRDFAFTCDFAFIFPWQLIQL